MQMNKTLLSLNLANCQMDERCGAKWMETTRINWDLIDFEFGFNKFTLEQVRTIQDNLRRNKRKYDEDRLREWRERKLMNEEDIRLKNLYLEEQARKEQERMEEEARELREQGKTAEADRLEAQAADMAAFKGGAVTGRRSSAASPTPTCERSPPN
jgi:hypothetical protein